jgi:osmotically-inducible protein OsmY
MAGCSPDLRFFVISHDARLYWQQAVGKRLACVKCVAAVLFDHASHGNLVYHGYVGHLLLAGISHVLRVREIADLEYRIQAARQQTPLRREQAVAHIQRVDAERSRWTQFRYGVDWENPVQYCVVLNLSQLGVESAAETIARMADLPEFKPTAASQQRFDDLRLASRVWAAMAANPATRNAGIEVTAQAGNVLIRGTAGSGKAAELIPQLASAVPGVKHVQCEAGLGADWYW